MTRFTTTLIALIALLGMLALVPVTAASAGTPGGPRTWHVLVGGQSDDQAVQAEGYYPHVITIDAGATVAWTLNSPELHGIVVPGTCPDFSLLCFPPDCLTVNVDFSPCGPSSFEPHGVTFLAGQPLPQIPDWFLTSPTGNGISYDGSSYFNSGQLYMPDAGRTTSLTLTFTKAGTFPYIDVADFFMEMHGTVTVTPP
jgi:plastocyanin